MIIQDLQIDSLREYEHNPRNNEPAVAAVAESIKQFGFKVPVVVDKNRTIIAGHTRVKAAAVLGLDVVPCIVADDLSPEQIKAFRLADNKTAELAEWDFDLLEQELAELTAFDVDMTAFGFDEALFEIDEPGEVVEDEAPEINEEVEPVTKPGDIWQLGRHRLMCGDSTSIDDVKELMRGDHADMLLTDPPYNVDYQGGTKDKLTIQNDNMDNDSFRDFLRDAFSAADSVMRAGAVFYIWHADSEGYNFRGACFDVGWKVRQCLIWNKNSMVMGRQDYHWKHEPCLYGWKDGAAHLWTNDRTQTTVIDYQRPTKAEIHPTMKPVGLFDYQIKNNSKPGDIVLDLFNGSGTTIIACEQNGRAARCMEIDPRYVDAAVKRWEELTGEKAIRTVAGYGDNVA